MTEFQTTGLSSGAEFWWDGGAEGEKLNVKSRPHP